MCNDTHTFVSFFKACPKEYLFFQQELQNLVVSDKKALTATRLIQALLLPPFFFCILQLAIKATPAPFSVLGVPVKDSNIVSFICRIKKKVLQFFIYHFVSSNLLYCATICHSMLRSILILRYTTSHRAFPAFISVAINSGSLTAPMHFHSPETRTLNMK